MGGAKLTDTPVTRGKTAEAQPDLHASELGSGRGSLDSERFAEAQMKQAVVHKVKAGETFSSIAREHHLDVKELMKANTFRNERNLQVGDQLVLPGIQIVKTVTLSWVTDVKVLVETEPTKGSGTIPNFTDYTKASAALDAVRRGEKQLYYRPGVPLDQIPADPAVKGLQQLVRDLHLDPHVEASGKFDRKTDDVVRDVERRFGLPQTGIAGKHVVECIDLLTKEYERIQRQNAHVTEAAMDRAIREMATPAQPPAASKVHVSGAGACPVAITATLNREKGVNASKDDHGNRGGFVTNFGVTAPFYNEYLKTQGEAPIKDPKLMNQKLRGLGTMEVAMIYEQMVFDRHHLDKLPPQTAIGVHDMVVVHGPRSIQILQRLLGVNPTGFIGDQTKAAASAWSDTQLAQAYGEKRKETFRSIANHDSSLERFLPGWVRRTDEVTATSLSPQTGKMIRFYAQNGTENWDLLDPVRHAGLTLSRATAPSNYIVMRRLQEQLNERGGVGAVKIDGAWGKEMDGVVATLRQRWGLPASGVWDAACQSRLDHPAAPASVGPTSLARR